MGAEIGPSVRSINAAANTARAMPPPNCAVSRSTIPSLESHRMTEQGRKSRCPNPGMLARLRHSETRPPRGAMCVAISTPAQPSPSVASKPLAVEG